MAYQAPGLVQGAPKSVLDAWNRQIDRELSGLLADPSLARAADYLASPDDLPPAAENIHWPADPAEPRFCLDEQWAQKLSDWGVRGRHNFHNEYCEYVVTTAIDADGKVRPKRFTATTELAEWWTTAASEDPTFLKSMAEVVLGRIVTFEELYGGGVGDPNALTPKERLIRFATEVAGHGQHAELKSAGVPDYPVGDLNSRNALFMCHPINGLDDLLYIVIFGAQPYVVNENGQAREALLHEIFNAQGTMHLACRNADPAAAQGAFERVLKGVAPDLSSARTSKIGFANPIGMYFQSFQTGRLFYDDSPVPEEWTAFSRGEAGLKQRLEFGPPDDLPIFLDDIIVREGAAATPVRGGYDIARLIEVGPYVLEGPEEVTHPNFFQIDASSAPECSEALVCSNRVAPAKMEYENGTTIARLRGR